MILDLREFEDFPAQTVITADPGELSPFADSIVEVKEASVDLSIQMAGEEYFCQGQAHGRVLMECARCLRQYTAELAGKTDFIVCSESQREARQGVIDDEDYVFFKGTDLRVEILEPVRQALVLAVPLKPLCSEDCQGLCASCGANLNEQSCDCEQENTDPRWEGLKGLLPEE